MARLTMPFLLAVRLLSNEGLILEQRRFPAKPRPKEINTAIARPWRRGVRRSQSQAAFHLLAEITLIM